MKFRSGAKLDTDQVDDVRDSGSGIDALGGLLSGGKVAAGGALGVIGLLLAVVLSQCAGGPGGSIDLSAPDGGGMIVTAGDPGSAGAASDLGTDVSAGCRTGEDANQRQDCRIVGVANSVQAYWAEDLARRQDAPTYTPAPTVLFSGRVQTGCGAASTAIGPFYCPADRRVYLDLDFFRTFESTFGGRDTAFTEAYVVAHEYGHHLQNLLGITDQVERSGGRSGADSASVRVELQADCFAGVWAHNATAGPDPLIVELTPQDISEGLDAAARVGDDYIQQNLGNGRVNPDQWTHGSSADRQRWFRTGYQSGELTDCDTFNTNNV